MTGWTDEALDRELARFLESQAEQTGSAPGEAEMVARLARRLHGAPRSSMWRTRPAMAVAILSLLLALVLGAALTAGTWRPALLSDSRPDGPIAVVVDPAGPSATPTPELSALVSAPSASAVVSIPSEAPSVTPAEPSPSAASPSVVPTASPTAEPTVVPVLDPAVSLLLDGLAEDRAFSIDAAASVDVELRLVTRDLDASRCTVTHRIEPDKQEVAGSTVALSPVPMQAVSLIDGRHSFSASCPSVQGVLKADVRSSAIDRQPERCKDFVFPAADISVSTIDELSSGIVGTWQGCVATPWVPAYFVTMTFRADGSYSAGSTEVLDGQQMVAMYYGTDPDNVSKRYAVNDLQASMQGTGQIDVYFGDGSGSVNRGDLRNIKLMGDVLEFEFFHRGVYGPLTFQLVRLPPG
jgi:hypothetical protein